MSCGLSGLVQPPPLPFPLTPPPHPSHSPHQAPRCQASLGVPLRIMAETGRACTLAVKVGSSSCAWLRMMALGLGLGLGL